MTLTPAQLDRVVGALLGTAAGDALGAPYEFGPPRGPDLEVAMVGGGSFAWEPGEWTDDTSMAIAIAEVAARGANLREEQALDALVQRWHEWSQSANDVGVQTRSVLGQAGRKGISAQTAREESAELHKFTGRTAGNGSLMRTAPIPLAHLDDEAALVEAARAVSELTHYDPEAGDACVVWCCAIRHAILTGLLDVRIGLQHIDSDRLCRLSDSWAIIRTNYSRLVIAQTARECGVGAIVNACGSGDLLRSCLFRGRSVGAGCERRRHRLVSQPRVREPFARATGLIYQTCGTSR